MAMAVCYGNFGGRIISEVRGGEERDYVRDTLGSTAELVDETGSVTDTFEYWPYGEIRLRTGTTATPFSFVGVLGYFSDGLDKYYARARSFSSVLTRWFTLDPLWPKEPPYAYARLSPTVHTDPSGLSVLVVLVPVIVTCAASSFIFLLTRRLYGTGAENDHMVHCVAECLIASLNFPCALFAAVATECIGE